MSGDDIVERLRLLGSIDCPYGCDLLGNPAADEIGRLRANLAAERALADQLADAHYSDGVTWGCGCAVNDDGILACDSAGRPCPLRRPASTRNALAAYREARRER